MTWYRYTPMPNGIAGPVVKARLRRGDRTVELFALLDSGADTSLLDLALAEQLGLDPANAQQVALSVADGGSARALDWPGAQLVIEFEAHRAEFIGQFIDVGQDGSFVNLLGRTDFFSGVIVQLWNDRGLFNLDASPDAPHDPLTWTA